MGTFEKVVTLNGWLEKSFWLSITIDIVLGIVLWQVTGYVVSVVIVIVLFHVFFMDQFVGLMLAFLRLVTSRINEDWSQKVVSKVLWSDWILTDDQRAMYLDR